MSRYTGKLGELYKSYSRAVSLLPADRLRPTHCYRNALKQQMESRFEKLSTLRGEESTKEMSAIERELTALSNLASNRYKSGFKVSEALCDPVSNKGYYTRLLDSIDSAIKSNKKTSLRVD
ncbi:hypothetical protein GGI12_002430 [Dipsacomyces acuminosporus]|nr:hypothetical protein GGI12_002430 [Dipsacomyces acuminosporus]